MYELYTKVSRKNWR